MRLTWWNMKHIYCHYFRKSKSKLHNLFAICSRQQSVIWRIMLHLCLQILSDGGFAGGKVSIVQRIVAQGASMRDCTTIVPCSDVQWTLVALFNFFYGCSLFNVCCTMFVMYRQQNERQWSDCPEASKSSTHWCLLSHNHITINSIDAKHDNLKMHKED